MRNVPNPRLLPFIYAFNPSGLTVGNAYTQLSIKTDLDARFHCTQIIGANKLSATGFRLYRRDGSTVQKALVKPNPNIIIPPYLTFEPGDQIVFDVAAITNADCNGIVGFQGYREFPNDIALPPKWLGDYYEENMSYTVGKPSITLVPNAVCGQIQTSVSVRIQDYDFELRRILAAYDPTSGLSGGVDSMTIQLLDPSLHRLSNIPVPLNFLSYSNVSANFDVFFPVPPIVYPKGSEITAYLYNLEATSELNSGAAVQLIADGVHRKPCR